MHQSRIEYIVLRTCKVLLIDKIWLWNKNSAHSVTSAPRKKWYHKRISVSDLFTILVTKRIFILHMAVIMNSQSKPENRFSDFIRDLRGGKSRQQFAMAFSGRGT
ncbi:hypothetical protein ACU8KH_01621 [Lachancea thermotolerans]